MTPHCIITLTIMRWNDFNIYIWWELVLCFEMQKKTRKHRMWNNIYIWRNTGVIIALILLPVWGEIEIAFFSLTWGGGGINMV